MTEVVDRVLRDHNRFTGDGLLPAVVGAALPIGDPASGVYNPTKADLRLAMGETVDAARSAAAAAAASAAGASLYDPSLRFLTLAALLLSIRATAGVGSNWSAGPYTYVEAASGAVDHDMVTAGGIKLYATDFGGAFYPAQFGGGQAGFEKAVTKARGLGLWCDGNGETIILSTAITAIPGKVRDVVIDASALATDKAWQPIGAAYEAAKPLTANMRQGARQVNVTAHGYAVGDIVLVQSNLVIETGTNAQAAHWGRISAVTANTFTTHEAALCNLMLADGASVRRLPKSAAVDMRNVKIICGTTCVNGFWPVRFTDVTTDMVFESCKSRSLTIQECYAPYVKYNRASNSDATGLGYGLAVVGCGWARVDLAVGKRCRHTFTAGASGVIPTVGVTVGDVIAYESLAAGMDTHPATMGFSQTGKAVVYMSNAYAGEDGIVCQAIGGSINCEINGVGNRNAVTIQPFHVAAAFDTPPSFTGLARSSVQNNRGVFVDFKNCGPVKSVDVDYFGSSTLEAVYFDIGPIAVDSLRVSGAGTSTAGRAMRVDCVASTDLGFLEQFGNWQGAASEVSYIFGQTAAGSRTTQWVFSSGRSTGGTHGMRASNKVTAIVGATFLAGSTAPTFVGGGATITVLT